MALNLYQRAVDDSMLDGKSTIWVTERQAGKTFLAHHIATRYTSVAYICPNYPMTQRHRQTYTNSRIQYFTSERAQFWGNYLSGFGLIVVDDFEHVHGHILERVKLQANHQPMLLLATKWEEFLLPALPVPNNNDMLNKFVTSFPTFNMFVG